MIPKECKRLAEVDFPIAVVSKHSAREKSIRHGHPSTLHLWWARRPLAACRAMLLALLWPDPCDPNCPQEFKDRARVLLAPLPGKLGKTDEDLRKALLRFIGDFSDWNRSADLTYLEASRALVKTAHGEEPPLVVDSFAGGGSIPLESLRIGCDTFASDLNPVACLILKVMLEDIPRYGRKKLIIKKGNGEEIEVDGLAEALRIVGKDIKEAALNELKEFYPDDPDGAKPIAYLWARTVKCEAPNCGAEIPLIRSLWLCKKSNRKRALRYNIVRKGNETPHIEFEIFEPTSEKEVSNGTVTRAKAQCPCCNTVLPPERVREQLTEQRGGADVVFNPDGYRKGGSRLLAVVTLQQTMQGRNYRLPTDRDYQSIWKVQKRLKTVLNEWERSGNKGFCPVPNELLPLNNTNCFRIPNYGIREWSQVFNERQRNTLNVLADAVGSLDTKTDRDLSEVLSNVMAIVVSRCADASSSLSAWRSSVECNRATFARQALSMVWDFCEAVPTSPAAGGYDSALNWVVSVAEMLAACQLPQGQVQNADATEYPLPNETSSVFFTDPPYYDAVGYAELSDFFFVWLKRATANKAALRDVFDPENTLVPKTRECVQDERYLSVEGRPKDRTFFETSMGRAFGEGRRIINDDGIGCVVFAHKSTEGWEALLSGMINGGWTITGSWPIVTERPGRLRSQDSAALATSVHLVCRTRSENAPVGDWGEVLIELPKRVGDWMERLQKEHIRGADLVFACIGPALEIFSRYSRVETAEGTEITLAQYLEKVWEVVGRSALEQILGTSEAQARNGMAGALEEDARLTALFLWTLQSTNGDNGNNHINDDVDDDDNDDEEAPIKAKTKGFSLIFDVVRRFAQPLGIHLPEWEGRIIETKKGVVRLFSISERAEQLFGREGTQVAADRIEHSPLDKVQMTLFPELEEERIVRVRGRRRSDAKQGTLIVNDEALNTRREATTLDRVHAAMLLQTSGKANALRTLLKSEQDRGPDFLRLANALSALYPKNSEEKRLIDAMLLAMPR